MKETIFRYAGSTRVRVISVFLAVLIFSLMFTCLFENLGFNKVNAATQVSGPNIAMNTNVTGIESWKNAPSSDSRFTYTGNILAQTANVYDYLSDEEVSPGIWNTGITKSRVSGYNDPYTQFNTYVSNSNGIVSAGTSNITIVFQDFGSWAVGTDEVCIFLEDDSGHHNTWYGDRMTYIASNNTFKYTFNETALGFTPTKIKIYNKNGNGTLPTTAEKKGFRFEDDNSNFGYKENGENGYKAGHTYYIKWRCPFHQGDHSHIWESSGAEPIYGCKYNVPLYFGCFLSTGDANDADNYNEHTAPNYNNFYWRPNLAFRADTDASVQKLVDNTLTGGNITQNNVELPYFKSTNNNVMKSWENKAFPFYEVLTDRGNATSYVSGTASTDTKAKFYQFNSADTNVYFDGTKFIEQENAVEDQESSKGYFPFNQNGTSADNLNLGFGTKFVIPFKLNSDGKVYAVNDQGKEVTGAGKVNARFEFEGDDDLWVFIDDNLILDMGGAHKKAKGYIDFAQQKAVVETNGVDFSPSNDCDNLSTVLNEEKTLLTGTDFTNKLLGGYDTTVVDGKAKGYSTSQQHKMTVFYMERGMINSNLLIRFNFAAESNFSKMKIQEQTNFSTVNEGLKNAAKKAADYDVFKYTVSNSGTEGSIILNSSALYPTRKNHIRNVQGTQTKLTSGTTPYVSPNTESKCFNFDATDGLVKQTSYLWVDKFANMYNPDKGGDGKGTGLTDKTGGFLYLMYGTEELESSAEFEGQFSRYSMMTVTQDSQLYKADSHAVNTTDAATTFSTGRTIGDYYTVSKPYIYSRMNVTEAGRVELANDTTPYVFRNNIKDSVNTNVTSYTLGSDSPDADLFSAVQMTEVFVNTVNVGAISVTKNVNSPSGVTDGETGNSDRFEFTVQFTDVFGVSGVTVDDYTDITVTGDAKDSNGANITKLLSGGKFYLKKGGTATISGIPVGTKYTITETTNTNYEASGSVTTAKTIANGTVSGTTYTPSSVTETIINTRLTGSLELVKAEGTNWAANGITPSTQFQFTVTLTKPSTISFDNFKAYFTDVSTNYTENSSAGTLTRVFDMVKGTLQTISGIPSGTTYSVVETNTGGSSSQTTENTSGTIGNGTVTATITNNYPAPSTNEIILKKTAKEQVGTTKIGDTLAGAKFKLVKVNGSSEDNSLRFTLSTVEGKNTYTLGTSTAEHNLEGHWLTTGSDGKLTIEGLSPGDYYLEEQTAPAGYVATDSNNSNAKKKVYFSVGDNTTTKYLTCSDEMAPAYIRLFEHINDFLPDEWGHPTFIYKITKTGGKTSYVGLTFDGTKTTEQKINGTIKYYTMSESTLTAHNFTTDPIDNSKYADWYVEGTTESEYKGVYHIDSQGRIRVEPGEYTITRIPVSRYEFVTSGHVVYATGTEPSTIDSGNITTGTEAAETITIIAGQTDDIHYYDKIGYYDKFTHIDTEVNKFYKLDESKKNTTVKGISVSNILSNAVTISDSTGTVNVSAYKVFVDGTIDTTAISASDLTIDFSSLGTSATDFSYNTTDGTITIQNATTTHHQKVYTVTAKYDNNKFTTTFDIAIP